MIHVDCAVAFGHCTNICERILQAVEQTSNVERGNVQLKKAIRLNSSARKYVAVFFFVASILILGFDWYAS